MALKLDPVRLLIADDVGIGKTIEACLIAREMIDRGEVGRLAVLCPPSLAEQWQTELHNKFHLEAELVLPSTASRLERQCRLGQSLFELYPYVIVSTDFMKSDRRRDEFLRTCPELVIVMKHTPALTLVKGRDESPAVSIALGSCVATRPASHPGDRYSASGNEEAFRSLLALLRPSLRTCRRT